MIRKLLIGISLLFALVCSASATPLVADLSNYRIHMDSSFNGTRMFLFGTRNESGDVVVAVRGPDKNYIVRKKEPLLGIWINRERMKFFNVPDYYAIASSKPLDDIAEFGVFQKLGIGETQLLKAPSGLNNPEKFKGFSEAFMQHQRNRNLYITNPQPISFMGETLFKTVIEFPDNIPSGNYTAEIYLISEGDIVGMQSTPIKVMKTGIDAFVYNYAHNHPFLYGITAVLIALSAGWFGGRLFEKK
ncbi:MAG: TIGR02186 family protein [Alphaproteobacteria bacterium]